MKKVQRIKTKQPGVYKNSVTNKYDVKYCYTIVDMATSKKKYMQKWCYGINSYKDAVSTLNELKGAKFKPSSKEITLKDANENIVLGFQTLASSQRRALVENNISYISENEQLFIPFLGSYFTKCQENQMSKPIDKFSPSSQLLALYMIYSEKSKRINKSEVAKRIGISAMAITRAVRDLAQIGVLQEEKVGNEVFIYCDMEKQDIYKEITPYLINPIQEIIYVSQIESEKELLLKAGEYSLSKRSMLGYSKYEEYALAKNSDFFERTETFNPDLDANVKLVRIQKWLS